MKKEINATIEEFTNVSLRFVPKLINSLNKYCDQYSVKLNRILSHYLQHKSFKRMREEYDSIDSADCKFHRRWNFNTRALLLEVIYPTILENEN